MYRLAILLALSGCATTEHVLYLDLVQVANPQAICGAPACIQRMTYRGLPLCRVVSGRVAYSEVGELIGECLK